jgi:streptogramin lyase
VTIPDLALINLRVSDRGAVYARQAGTTRVVRLDPDGGSVDASVEIPGSLDQQGRLFYGLAAGSLWATIPESGVLHELDPETLEIRRQIELPTTPAGNYWTHASDALLVNGYGDDEAVWQIDPASGSLGPRLATPKADGSVAAFGSVWTTNPDRGTVTRIHPATGETDATIEVGPFPGDIGVAGGAVWVSDRQDGTITRIDPHTNQATARTEAAPGASDYFVGAVFEADGTAWALVAANDTSLGGIVALDLASGQTLGGRLLPGRPGGLQRLGDGIVAMVDLEDGSALLTIDTDAARSAPPG